MNHKLNVSAVSFRLGSNNRIKNLEDAISSLPKCEHKIILLPGYSLGQTVDKNVAIQKITNLSIKYESYIFAETDCFQLFTPDGSIYDKSFYQLFHKSNNATSEKVFELLQKFNNGERVIKILGYQFALLICGENNILKNLQSEGNRPVVRHTNDNWSQSYDVLINPSHDRMGNWGKLEKRFSAFSTQNRWALYCTNNSALSLSWKSCLRLYRNGFRIQDGDNAKTISDNWRLISFELDIENKAT